MANQPPVIPEIAKAYENDPRTKLALSAIASGTATSPVAQGQYGIADGIARALQATMGGYINKKQEAKYEAQQDQLLAQRAARGADGLSGVAGQAPAPPATPVAPPAVPPAAAAPGPAGGPSQPNAAAIASALGSPPPGMSPQASQGPAPIPMAPIPTPTPAGAGAAPGGKAPFGVSSPVSAGVAPANKMGVVAPQLEAVPDAPAPVAKPTAPEAVKPTRSKLLDAAYRIMTDANPYESAAGQEMYTKGLSDQTDLDEKGAERQQKLRDMAYQSDLEGYRSASDADRNAIIARVAAAESRNFQRTQKVGDQTFEGTQNALKTADEDKRNTQNIAKDIKVAQMKIDADKETMLTPDAIKFAASQVLSGDPSALQNMGRGKQGALAVIAVRNEVQRQAADNGIDGPTLATINAKYFGQRAEARAAGTRVGATDVATSEVPLLAEQARSTHKALIAQGSLVPWNRAVQMVQQGTSSPELARAVAATGAVTNAYARSFGTGVLAKAAQKKAEDQLSVAWGTPAYEAALDQIIKNTNLERQGAKAAIAPPTGKPPATTRSGATVSKW